MKISDEIKKRCEQYPLYSQEKVVDQIFCAKLFFPMTSAVWYIAEYNPVTFEAYGYVMGLGDDEWGYFSIAELVEVKLAGVFSIELDLAFSPTRSSEIEMPH
ncbi:MAG: DUF2958 domain-containing protein [Pseudomonadota bacterium]